VLNDVIKKKKMQGGQEFSGEYYYGYEDMNLQGEGYEGVTQMYNSMVQQHYPFFQQGYSFSQQNYVSSQQNPSIPQQTYASANYTTQEALVRSTTWSSSPVSYSSQPIRSSNLTTSTSPSMTTSSTSSNLAEILPVIKKTEMNFSDKKSDFSKSLNVESSTSPPIFNPTGKKNMWRSAGGEVWKDSTLSEWSEDDYRIFVGDLGRECTEDMLIRAFSVYPSLQKVRLVVDKHSKKTRGYAFVSFKDPHDYLKALKEMNGKYIGSRPIKLRKSSWKDRNIKRKDIGKLKSEGLLLPPFQTK
jgi:hypothetical protein